ncbi:peptide-methionine (S)-S-oxide reductase/peptide methionine sulfoxide reductase msrA/msrB [Balnearium lithotrophicum]|uniref:Peptide methionine sulfoxide reductase MsrA n=1 Tax=Balnearium lithotrophicum TaxID=223788 RepID=A0A521BH91_9BACT|nr:peptide-methionine (S)-S-oxide reductase MsrA [Balnearium lithotrophicum]SMO46498.1 peptide-methionine (S)-S-oxide reductase/peptide methionine sulfoxide reductase msrA/msrB [Balnearium lithotrophicum]
MEKVATFAGGCFWCIEEAFSKLPGVVEVTPGYSGGNSENPTYEEVCTGKTGHVEAVQVKYNPKEVSYRELLITFLTSIDPTDRNGQFADRGSQYRPVIFYHDEEQKELAEKALKILSESSLFSDPIAVEVRPFKNFYPAEEYHRRYFEREPMHYYYYKEVSGRKAYCEIVWKKKGGKELLEKNL